MPKFARDWGAGLIRNGLPYVRVGIVMSPPDDAITAADTPYLGAFNYNSPDGNGLQNYSAAQRTISKIPIHSGVVSQSSPGATEDIFTAPSAGVIRLHLNSSLVNTTIYLNGDSGPTGHPPGTFFTYEEFAAFPVLMSAADVISFFTGGTYAMYYTFLPNVYP